MTQPIAAIPGSSEPMKPVRVKTVQIKAGQVKLAAAGPAQEPAPVNSTLPPAQVEIPETSSAVMARAETAKSETATQVAVPDEAVEFPSITLDDDGSEVPWVM